MEAKLIDFMGSDLTVVNAARVSFDKESGLEDGVLSDKDKKLVKYLADHEHLSPFGHCFASFRVKAPIFVARQLQKHAYLRMNEISRRYVDTPPEFYTPTVWRGRPVDKKQGSGGPITQWPYLMRNYKESLEWAFDTYNSLITEGVAPEQARMVLPQSMYTEWYWSGSLDAFANMCKLRCKSDAQEETRLIANQISEQMKERFPISWSALVD